MYPLEPSAAFERGVKRCKRKHWDVEALKDGIIAIANSDKEKIPESFADHRLEGKYKGCREIHLLHRKSDWLLVYKIEDGKAKLIATGKHDEIF